ncbi:MAG: hypothetical protein K2P78_10395 [Gemmataceae bacterium]|nr:hypothetical protein [Gemmataceae bacterium]
MSAAACPCQFCAAPLEPAQQLRFLVESATLDDPTHLSRIRRLPATADGRPLRVCSGCQSRIEADHHRFRADVARASGARQLRTGVLAAVGVLSAGWVLRVLLGARA